jgi:uncharacterized membrane protein
MNDRGEHDRLGKILFLLIIVAVLFYATPLLKIFVLGKFSLISIGYMISPLIFLIITYFIHGKEINMNETGYEFIYERQPPSKSTISEIYFFANGKKCKKEKHNELILAVILDFINKKYLEIKKEKNEIYLNLNPNYKQIKKNINDKIVLDFLKKKYGTEKFSMKQFNEDYYSNVDYYYIFNSYFSEQEYRIDVEKYINNEGQNKIIGFIINYSFIFFGILFLFGSSLDFNNVFLMFISLFVWSIGFSIIEIHEHNILFNKWTKEGRIMNAKWKNFKKYITDYSMLKEHPPQSVKLWEEYLIYAVVLGVAKKTINVMKQTKTGDNIRSYFENITNYSFPKKEKEFISSDFIKK